MIEAYTNVVNLQEISEVLTRGEPWNAGADPCCDQILQLWQVMLVSFHHDLKACCYARKICN